MIIIYFFYSHIDILGQIVLPEKQTNLMLFLKSKKTKQNIS